MIKTCKAIMAIFSLMFFIGANDHPSRYGPIAKAPAVVVELFTSQGCAGCPAADLLLSKLIADGDEMGHLFVGMSFHVTYFDHMGWKDPYSDTLCDQRQASYAQRFSYSHMYTPQVVVNGTYEFAGASQTALDAGIAKALRKPSEVLIRANAHIEGQQLRLDYMVEGLGVGSVVNIAVVDSHVENHVPQGDNKDRRLRHRNVVRVFERHHRHQAKGLEINIPEDVDKRQAFLAIYAQEKTSMKVLGASKISIRNL